jgi:hypothetical protein
MRYAFIIRTQVLTLERKGGSGSMLARIKRVRGKACERGGFGEPESLRDCEGPSLPRVQQGMELHPWLSRAIHCFKTWILGVVWYGHPVTVQGHFLYGRPSGSGCVSCEACNDCHCGSGYCCFARGQVHRLAYTSKVDKASHVTQLHCAFTLWARPMA